MTDPVPAFTDAMRSAGITPPRVVPDGKLRRFHVEGDTRGSRNGWFVLYPDELPAGAFGCWKRGISETWCAKSERTLTEPERIRWRERMDDARKARDAEEQATRERAAAKAIELWREAKPADPAHPYLQRKGVKPHGIRQLGDRLVVPLGARGNGPVGLQFIEADPTVEPGKRFLRGTPKTGHYCRLGQVNGRVAICEGYATAASVHEATGMAAIVAFDAGNLPHVAKAIRAAYPETEIIVAGDADEVGRTRAGEAARAVGGRVAIPEFGESETGSDWNDLATERGLGAVRLAFDSLMSIDIKPQDATSPMGDTGKILPVEGVRIEDFHAYMPMHSYIFVPTRELWPASSVNARVPKVDGSAASAWLDANQAVEQMTWSPGDPLIIEDRLIAGGGWIDRPGVRCFNLYRPAQLEHGDASLAGPWLEHVNTVFPLEAAHIVRWFAHRVQRPHEKINHALALIGPQGTGKDTIVAGPIPAVGPWNVSEVSPDMLMGRFNGFIKSVILRVSEARDLGDTDRYRLYEHLKTYTAAPPDVLRIDEKHVREYAVPNVTGVIITSNHVDGIYLPADDRRHYVALTERTKEDFTPEYWHSIYRWYEQGGYGHVAAYLASLDLSDFDPKAPPPKTPGFWAVVDAGRAPEDGEVADVLERLGYPAAITLPELALHADPGFAEWLKDRRNARQVPHRLETAGYVAVRNDTTQDGRWKVGGKNQMVYARRELPIRDRIAAARALTERAR